MSDTIILDIATSSLPDAAAYLDVPRAPANYKDETKIAAYVAEKTAERLAGAALDLDLCRLTGYAVYHVEDQRNEVAITRGDDETERVLLVRLSALLRDAKVIIAFNGRSFDVPVLKRRARYRGVSFPDVSTDRFKSPIVDLLDILSDRDPSRRRSLGFYARRLKMDLGDKPLDGADEARVPETNDWDTLAASLKWDVTAIHRLAQWMGVL